MKKVYILITALLLGSLILAQSRSFRGASDLLFRENQSNVFQEIKVLKAKNEDLKKEVSQLENNLEQLSDQNSALSVIEEEIEKYRKLDGNLPISGPGIEVEISGDITAPWMTDLINEFFVIGAQAVDINGIRITNSTTGFDVLPRGQILINGSILSQPYSFRAIGEKSTLNDILELPGGIVDRLRNAFSGIEIEITQLDKIGMQ